MKRLINNNIADIRKKQNLKKKDSKDDLIIKRLNNENN